MWTAHYAVRYKTCMLCKSSASEKFDASRHWVKRIKISIACLDQEQRKQTVADLAVTIENYHLWYHYWYLNLAYIALLITVLFIVVSYFLQLLTSISVYCKDRSSSHPRSLRNFWAYSDVLVMSIRNDFIGSPRIDLDTIKWGDFENFFFVLKNFL